MQEEGVWMLKTLGPMFASRHSHKKQEYWHTWAIIVNKVKHCINNYLLVITDGKGSQQNVKGQTENMKGKQPDHAILLKITFLQQCWQIQI